VPAADAKPSHAPDSRQVSRLLHIDIAKLREQSVISPDGERTPKCRELQAHQAQDSVRCRQSQVGGGNQPRYGNQRLAGEGKSFCTVNLAISIAMETNRTVLLVRC
jgi:Mrp family chromosome partitioning ATPase